MKLRFTRRAIENLTEIAAYLNERNPGAVLRVRGAIAESLEYLTSFPQVGRAQTTEGVRKLVDDNIPFRNLEEAPLPVHIVATDNITGDAVVMSEGPTADAILASTSIPGAFSPIRYKDHYLADGAISSNTPVRVAVSRNPESRLGMTRNATSHRKRPLSKT